VPVCSLPFRAAFRHPPLRCLPSLPSSRLPRSEAKRRLACGFGRGLCVSRCCDLRPELEQANLGGRETGLGQGWAAGRANCRGCVTGIVDRRSSRWPLTHRAETRKGDRQRPVGKQGPCHPQAARQLSSRPARIMCGKSRELRGIERAAGAGTTRQPRRPPLSPRYVE